MRHIFTLLAIFAFGTSYSQLSIDVRDLGAVGNGSTVNTAFIQQAVDSVSNAGGGEVLITGGTYISTTIVLKSNVTLRITSDATLKATASYGDYPDHVFNVRSWNDDYTTRSLLFAEDAHHIRITGGGTIDGNGLQVGYFQVSVKLRPYGLRLHTIDSLTIDSITLRQAPQWMAVIYNCTHVHIYNVTVYNQCLGSNDGLDIDGCRDVLIENCNFDTNDDPVPVKTHGLETCRDIMVRNCTMASYERAVKVGNECFGPIINVHFENITVNQSSATYPIVPLNAIYIAVADGGSIDSVFFEHIRINTPSQTSIFIKLCERNFQYDTTIAKPAAKYLRNVWINDVVATSSTTIPCSVTGIPGHPLENIHFQNVKITVPGNGPIGTTNIPELETTRPECDIWGNILPAYGLYVRHVNGITLDSFCVYNTAAEVRPLCYFEDVTGIQHGNECWPLGAGISDEPANAIKVFPNPSSNILNVNDLPAEVESVTLYNAIGAKVVSLSTGGKAQLNMNVSELPVGVYTLLITGRDFSTSNKVIIAR